MIKVVRWVSRVVVVLMLCMVTQVSYAERTNSLADTSGCGSPAVVNPIIRSQHQDFISLDGEWQFTTDPKKVGDLDKWYLPDKVLPNVSTISVPGCWEAQGVGEPGKSTFHNTPHISYTVTGKHHEYEGTAWYRKEVRIPVNWSNRQVWLKFGGVNAQGWVYVNGTGIAHLGGPETYCGTYKFNITKHIKPGTTLVIVVKVRNDVFSIKGAHNVARRYGGIDRSVELEATPTTFIDYATVSADVPGRMARIHVTVRRVAGTSNAQRYVLKAVLRDAKGDIVGRGEIPVETSTETVDKLLTVGVEPCTLWSPNTPALYQAELTLLRGGKILHGWTERFGMCRWEVRGPDIYLNGKKFFVRGIGFDAHWPLSICSPVDRTQLRSLAAKIKSFGFNHIRFWAHTPVPEFFDAADEVGLAITAEMPYYHSTPHRRQGPQETHCKPLPEEYNIPDRHLDELITHYDRYPSLFTYCGGNEGRWEQGRGLMKTVHARSPNKLWTHQSGHFFNKPDVSDYCCDYYIRKDNEWNRSRKYRAHIPDFPHVLHEYCNLVVGFDPRNADKYVGGYLPPIRLDDYKVHVCKSGLSWPLVEAAIEAGQKQLAYFCKVSVENARLADRPRVNGYHFWPSINGDIHFRAAGDNGLLTPFFETKKIRPDTFRNSNQDIVLLSKITPAGKKYRISIENEHDSEKPKTEVYAEQLIFAAGDRVDMEFLVSNFSETNLKESFWWSISNGKKLLASGKAPCLSEQGGLTTLAKETWTIPPLDRAVRVTVTAGLGRITNSWEIWVFPKPEVAAQPLKGVAASDTVYAKLSTRYPGLVAWKSCNKSDIRVLLTDDVFVAASACKLGKRVVLLSFDGFKYFKPATYLNEWGVGTQMGTAILPHPVYGDFPNKDFLEPVFNRMLNKAVKSGGPFAQVSPLLVGQAYLPENAKNSLPNYLLHVFETRVGNGCLLATGMNLLSVHPESAYLLDRFLAYAHSDTFEPLGSFDIAAAMTIKDNGNERILKQAASKNYPVFLGEREVHLTYSDSPNRPLVWETTQAPKSDKGDWVLTCFVAMGTVDEKDVEFSLQVGGHPTVTVPFLLESRKLTGTNGIVVTYKAISSETNIVRSTIFRDQERAMSGAATGKERQSSGILTLRIPRKEIVPGKPLQLKVVGKLSEGRGWFGLIGTE